MKDLPQLNKYLLRFGIKPIDKGYSNKYTLIGFDTETIGNNDISIENDLYSIQVVKNSLNEEYFYLISKKEIGIDMLDFKTESNNYLFNRHSFITAHNLEFDLGAMLGKDFLEIVDYTKYKERKLKVENGNLLYKGWKIKFNLGQGSFFMFRKKDTKIIFSDSRNWYKGSLDSIGKSYFNIRKKDKPIFLGIRPPENKKEFEEFKEYAMQDARIQFLITQEIANYHKKTDLQLCITPASFTATNFRKNYLNNRLFIDNNLNKLKFIWSSYHGARFEAIGRGFFENMNMYDVNSLYPYSMKESPLNFSNSRMETINLNNIENGYVGFCKVDFEFKEDEQYPSLPVRNEKLVFPLKGESYCTTHELLKALEQGVNIKNIVSLGWYPKEEDIKHPLRKFVIDKYKEKCDIAKEINILEKENNDYNYEELQKMYSDYLFVKLQLNSLYGKFAQRNDVFDIDKEKKVEVCGSIFKPDFASLITGKSRSIIYQYMKDYNSVYCDTDSIITKKKLPSDLNLGGMKLEYKNLDFLIVRSKLYFGITNADNYTDTQLKEMLGSNYKEKIKDGKINIKSAKHGFRIDKQDVYNLLKQNSNSNSISYEVERMTKSLESIKAKRVSHCRPRKWVYDTFEIGIQEDGKRYFDRNLKTVEELFSNKLISRPLQLVKSIY